MKAFTQIVTNNSNEYDITKEKLAISMDGCELEVACQNETVALNLKTKLESIQDEKGKGFVCHFAQVEGKPDYTTIKIAPTKRLSSKHTHVYGIHLKGIGRAQNENEVNELIEKIDQLWCILCERRLL